MNVGNQRFIYVMQVANNLRTQVLICSEVNEISNVIFHYVKASKQHTW
jgi:hypothetical protein